MRTRPFFVKTVGRRKTAIANLELVPGSGKIIVNRLLAEDFFSGHHRSRLIVEQPFQSLTCPTFDANVSVRGGGLKSHAKSLQLSRARALLVIHPRNKKLFREYQFLTCDARKKERRKYGLKKSRKAPQFSKRL